MTALTGTEIVALVFVVILAVIIAGLLLYMLKRLKNRRNKLIGELSDRPELSVDRAFNRLAMARREAGILAGQGVDVRRAQELIAEGQGAFDTHQYDEAYRTAQSAHEALVVARQQGARSTGMPLPPAGTGSPLPTTGSPAPVAATPPPVSEPTNPPAPHPAIPKNRAESQFQIRLLTEELTALPPNRARDSSARQASALKDQASAAFDRGDYTEAFRLSLRARRALGGHLETLPPTVGTPVPVPNGNFSAGGRGPDATESAEAVAGGERCPDCGYPSLGGDAFCRGCGRPRAPLSCPNCGAARGADEPFCGRCGNRFP